MEQQQPQASRHPAKKHFNRRQFINRLLVGGLLTAGSALAYQLGQRLGLALQPVFGVSPIQPPVEPMVTEAVAKIVRSSTAVPTFPNHPTPTAVLNNVPPSTPVPVQAHQPLHVPKPAMITQLEWGARQPSKPFKPQHPATITLHHEGVIFDGSIPAPNYLRNVQRWSIDTRGWPDIPYHFMIDREGKIYEGRPLDTRGDTNTSYNLQDHALIAVLGKYDKGEQQPTEIQIDAIVDLISWIAYTYNIPITKIHGHRDFIPVNNKNEHIDPKTHEHITCPGDNLYRYLEDGTIQHRVALTLQLSYQHRSPQYTSPVMYD